jgi:hypothetical protein
MGMSGHPEVSYTLEFGVRRRVEREERDCARTTYPPGDAIPRVARLMALAIRLEGLIREGAVRDYAELARLGKVTRARMTQINKLLHLAPDIQEQLLFLPWIKGLNERNLRPIVRQVDWDEQRRLFERIATGAPSWDSLPRDHPTS